MTASNGMVKIAIREAVEPEVFMLRDGIVRARRITLGRDLGKEVEVLDALKGDESLIVSPGDALAMDNVL